MPGERPAAASDRTTALRSTLESWEYAGLAGTPDDARVEVGTLGRTLYIEMGDAVAAAYQAYFYVRRDGAHLVLVNDGFHIRLRLRAGASACTSFTGKPSTPQCWACIASRPSPDTEATRTATTPGLVSASTAHVGTAAAHAADRIGRCSHGIGFDRISRGPQWWREHGQTIGVASIWPTAAGHGGHCTTTCGRE